MMTGIPAPPKRRLFWGLTLLLLGNVGGPLCIPLVINSTLSEEWKTTLSGILLLGVPELSILAAVSILGKPGFEYLKSRFFIFLKRCAPPTTVSPARYRIGIILLTGLLIVGFVEPYLGPLIPRYFDHRLKIVLTLDLLFLTSLFVLGGEFWDKLRSLFVHKAKVSFPA